MPANLVKPGQEEYWERAKQQASKQGHDKDWPYIVSIFQQMVKNKSMPPGDLEKGLRVPPGFRLSRVPGQVPSREHIEALKLAQAEPPKITVARLLEGGPILRDSQVVQDLGFDVAQEAGWQKFIEEVLGGATNELTMRQSIMAKAQDEKVDPVVRQIILERALSRWRGMDKSMVEIFTIDEALGSSDALEKAEARGGGYHKRVPRPGGGFRYYYDEDKYRSAKDAHTGGDENTEAYLSGKVLKAVQTAGEGGCKPDAFEALVKKYGAKKVAGMLKGGCGGKIAFKKGKFYALPDEGVPKKGVSSTPKKPKEKLVLTQVKKSEVLEKAGPHKYVSRKKDAKGNWTYEYPDDQQNRIVKLILEFLGIPKRKLTASGTARAFRIDKGTAIKILNRLEKDGKIQVNKTVGAWEYSKASEKPVVKKPVMGPSKPAEKFVIGGVPERTIKLTEKLNQNFFETKMVDGKPQYFLTPLGEAKAAMSLNMDPRAVPILKDMIAKDIGKTETVDVSGYDPEIVAFLHRRLILRDKEGGGYRLGSNKWIVEMVGAIEATRKEMLEGAQKKYGFPKPKRTPVKGPVKGEQTSLMFTEPEKPVRTPVRKEEPKPESIIEHAADKEVEEKAEKVVEEIQKPGKDAVTEKDMAKPDPPVADDPTVAFPLSSRQVKLLTDAQGELGLQALRTGKELRGLVEAELVKLESTQGKVKTYSLTDRGKEWLSKNEAKPKGEKVSPAPAGKVTTGEATKRASRSRKKIAVEQGEHVWGSRKDRFVQIQTTDDLGTLTPEDQARYATKKNLLIPVDMDAAMAQGKTPDYVLLRHAIEKSIQAQAGDNLKSRQYYMDGVQFVQKSLDNLGTGDGVVEFLDDWYHLAQGKKRVAEFTNAEIEKIRDDYTISKGREVGTPWRERLAIEKEYKDLRDKRRKLRYDPKVKMGDMEAIDKQIAKVNEKVYNSPLEPIDDAVAHTLGLDSAVVSSTFNRARDKWTYFAVDPDLEQTIKTNHYAQMMAGLGTNLIKLAGRSPYSRDHSGPKAWRDAVRLRDRTKNNTKAEQEDAYRTHMKVKKRKAGIVKQGPQFAWERDVSGEIKRTGGEPVESADTKAMAEEFGLNNVPFGTWVTEREAESHVKGLHGSLRDLSDLMGIDRKTISLNGRLSIGIGAWGKGRAKATYYPEAKLINLTKRAGGGSVAHEWAHAMDHILAITSNPGSTSTKQYLSHGENAPEKIKEAFDEIMHSIKYTSGVNEVYLEKIKELEKKQINKQRLSYSEKYLYKEYQSRLEATESQFYQDAKTLAGSGTYWRRNWEMFARCFESYIQDELTAQKRESSYLVSGTRRKYATGVSAEGSKEDAQPYPHGEERQRINAAMRKLVEVLQETKALEKSLERLYVIGS